ncbi:Beauvericin cluster-specific repressor [Lachnellula willkommii]|uniref:Beauvericin cluster-specific repressor n=1 Tax=Lachnellula willkommii TaxID=215461 RepID=A0A559M737_9HELO|nr:Beauvericin cluster-specific repressor [Lachnellula willkommii]
MVNNGRSGACSTCKRRKVKCDESRPSCQKCQSIGRSCPGYMDDWDLAFRSENQVVKLKVHSNGRKPARESPNVTTLNPTLWYVPNQLTPDIGLQVIPLFFRNFILPSRTHGWLDFLPGLLEQVSSSSVLHQAVYAAAYANIAQRYQSTELRYNAISYYCKAIKQVNFLLFKRSAVISDNTIIAVMLLGLYEVGYEQLSEKCGARADYISLKFIFDSNKFTNDLSLCHIRGLGALVDLRGMLLTNSHLLENLCCQIQRRNLDLGLMPGPDVERLIQRLDCSLIASQMFSGMYSVSKFQASTKADIASRRLDSNGCEAFLLDALKIEEQLCEWANNASRCLGYIVSTPPPQHRELFPNQDIEYHEHSGIWGVGGWCKHRAIRIILHQVILDALKGVAPRDSRDEQLVFEQITASLSVIHQQVHDIFSSVAFALGAATSSTPGPPARGVGGYFLIWSLKVVLRCPFISQEQYLTAKHVLWRIGKECGIGHAEKFSESLHGVSERPFSDLHEKFPKDYGSRFARNDGSSNKT